MSVGISILLEIEDDNPVPGPEDGVSAGDYVLVPSANQDNEAVPGEIGNLLAHAAAVRLDGLFIKGQRFV